MSRESVKVAVCVDWQAIDFVFEEGDDIPGFWLDYEFCSLSDTLRYGTPWLGDAPDFFDGQGNAVDICGVFLRGYTPYFVEVKDSEEIRLWREAA